jgi:hypothetical protein
MAGLFMADDVALLSPAIAKQSSLSFRKVADYTLFAYHPDDFAYIGFANRLVADR